MRILDGYDYYDSGMRFGRDETVCFVRENRTMSRVQLRDAIGIRQREMHIHLENERGKNAVYSPFHEPHHRYFSLGRFDYRFEMLTVIFCGARWDGVRIEEKSQVHPYATASHIFWTLELFREYLAGKKIVPVDCNWDPTGNWSRAQHKLDAPVRMGEYFGRKELPKPIYDWLADERIAILVGDGGRSDNDADHVWRINPGQNDLSHLEFHRVLDAWAAFQELSAYVGGVLAGRGGRAKPKSPKGVERKPVEIADIDKVGKHGFDPKWSFRRHRDDPK